MKITPSKDGEMRADVSIIFRLSVDDFVHAIVHKITDEWDFNGVDNVARRVETALKFYTSKDKILHDVKVAHRSDGNNLWARVETCIDGAALSEIREQARVLVLKKFPQFRKANAPAKET